MLEGVCDGGRIHYPEPSWIIPGTIGAYLAVLSQVPSLGAAPFSGPDADDPDAELAPGAGIVTAGVR
jgi:hypothetical protein